MKKIKPIHLIIAAAALAGFVIFFINQQQQKNFQRYLATVGQPLDGAVHVGTTTPSADQGLTETQRIEELQREVNELKNKPAKIIYQSVLTPAKTPSPADLKTQEELNRANEQINSLQQKLKEIQSTQTPAPVSAISDADLIKNWQVRDKVVQIACEDKMAGTWQMGSGVFISADGKILTNQHVVAPASGGPLPDFCLALFSRDFDPAAQSYKKEYRATINGFFASRDAALLKIQDYIFRDSAGVLQSSSVGGQFAYFQPAAAAPQIGDSVYVFGFPESANFSFSATKGIVSNYTSDSLYFGTDAQIDRGNSGGAAINRDGQLVGLPTYKFSNSGDYRGYILDINSLKLY